MRLNAGDKVRAFNGRNGEWLAELMEISKKNAIVTFVEKIGEQTASPDIWVLASPVKKEAFDMMVEKSAELGSSHFFPVLCERTVVSRVNRDRMQAMSIEAAEQCERLDVMEVSALSDLENLFETWNPARKLIFCIERAGALSLAKAISQLTRDNPLAILVGPEGGFTEKEIEYIRAQKFAVPVSLGPRILKAETALIAALACVQALYFTE